MTNDKMKLRPKTEFNINPHKMEFDFPEFKIGIAEYDEGPTGCTVFAFDKRVNVAIDIQGGSCATIHTPYNYTVLDTICFAGGSQYGLEAASGVMAERYKERGYSTHWNDIAIVSGAIIYDYAYRNNSIYPDKALGRTAYKSAKPNVFYMGRRGAGRNATVGNGFNLMHGEMSGQGAAYKRINDVKIAVFTVVNSLGAIVDRKGNVVRGHFNQETNTRYKATLEEMEEWINKGTPPYDMSNMGNTSLNLVVTNQMLSSIELKQLAKQVHSSMARVIQPFHTLYDGDILYAVSTGQIKDSNLNSVALGTIASELMCEAVLNSYEDYE